MEISHKVNISPQHQKCLKRLKVFLKEARFSEGKRQDDFTNFGFTRRQVQWVESGNNITLVRLFSILDVYGYKLSDKCNELF